MNPGGKTSVPDALRAKLDGTDIALEFVSFEARTDEERAAHDLFRGLIASLPAGSAYLTIDRVGTTLYACRPKYTNLARGSWRPRRGAPSRAAG